MRTEAAQALVMMMTGSAAAVGSVAQVVADKAVIVPIIGVSLPTLGMAVAGSLIAFAYGTPVQGRVRLLGYAVGGIFVGVWCAQLFPHLFGWRWYAPELQAPVAGIAALLSRWLVPLVIEQVPAMWNRIVGRSPK
jgi:hypothetical protein